ncbi:PaaI family thioesterase [Variovorax sp. GT1P44]|uniref:PaaI family thioesterase n=1 Tax=Variovorax sp. GT1P44 TaxID=3443742 RepID=UPI003F45BA96
MTTMTQAPHPAPPPPGFEQVDLGGTFATVNGPLFARWHGERLQLGFRVGPGHVNPGQNCHGGMLCTFADVLISTAAQYQTDIPRQFLPTISLQVDFLAVAPLGSWVQGQAEILQVTRNLIFSQGLIQADDQVVMRASGVFRRGPLLPESADDQALRLPGMPLRS